MAHACIYTFSFTYFEDTKYTETMLYTLHVAGMHDIMHYVTITYMCIVVFTDILIAFKNIKKSISFSLFHSHHQCDGTQCT